jgi:hypothetical protein
LGTYFTRRAPDCPSPLALGEEETISKNKETINKPAITAPIIISDPNLLSDSLLSHLHA